LCTGLVKTGKGCAEFSAGGVIRTILSPTRITRPPSSAVSPPHLYHAALILARQVLGGTAKHGKPDAALIVFRQGKLVARVTKAQKTCKVSMRDLIRGRRPRQKTSSGRECGDRERGTALVNGAVAKAQARNKERAEQDGRRWPLLNAVGCGGDGDQQLISLEHKPQTHLVECSMPPYLPTSVRVCMPSGLQSIIICARIACPIRIGHRVMWLNFELGRRRHRKGGRKEERHR
jgi:hypothetical protein